MGIDPLMQAKINALHCASGGPKDHKESSFQAFLFNLSSLEEIDLAYMKIHQNKCFADYIMLAY